VTRFQVRGKLRERKSPREHALCSPRVFPRPLYHFHNVCCTYLLRFGAPQGQTRTVLQTIDYCRKARETSRIATGEDRKRIEGACHRCAALSTVDLTARTKSFVDEKVNPSQQVQIGAALDIVASSHSTSTIIRQSHVAHSLEHSLGQSMCPASVVAVLLARYCCNRVGNNLEGFHHLDTDRSAHWW